MLQFLHLTVEEIEAQGHALLKGGHPFSGSCHAEGEQPSHLLSTDFVLNLTTLTVYQRKSMSYPVFLPVKLGRWIQPGCYHTIFSGEGGRGVNLGFEFGARVDTKAAFLHPDHMPRCAEACAGGHVSTGREILGEGP